MKNWKNKLSEYLKLVKLVGSGDWGNVYSSHLQLDNKLCTEKSYDFAIKMSRIKKADLKHPYSPLSTSWYEVIILQDILRPIIEKNICPNLPLIIDSFVCDSCSFILRNKKTISSMYSHGNRTRKW